MPPQNRRKNRRANRPVPPPPPPYPHPENSPDVFDPDEAENKQLNTLELSFDSDKGLHQIPPRSVGTPKNDLICSPPTSTKPSSPKRLDWHSINEDQHKENKQNGNGSLEPEETAPSSSTQSTFVGSQDELCNDPLRFLFFPLYRSSYVKSTDVPTPCPFIHVPPSPSLRLKLRHGRNRSPSVLFADNNSAIDVFTKGFRLFVEETKNRPPLSPSSVPPKSTSSPPAPPPPVAPQSSHPHINPNEDLLQNVQKEKDLQRILPLILPEVPSNKKIAQNFYMFPQLSLPEVSTASTIYTPNTYNTHNHLSQPLNNKSQQQIRKKNQSSHQHHELQHEQAQSTQEQGTFQPPPCTHTPGVYSHNLFDTVTFGNSIWRNTGKQGTDADDDAAWEKMIIMHKNEQLQKSRQRQQQRQENMQQNRNKETQKTESKIRTNGIDQNINPGCTPHHTHGSGDPVKDSPIIKPLVPNTDNEINGEPTNSNTAAVDGNNVNNLAEENTENQSTSPKTMIQQLHVQKHLLHEFQKEMYCKQQIEIQGRQNEIDQLLFFKESKKEILQQINTHLQQLEYQRQQMPQQFEECSQEQQDEEERRVHIELRRHEEEYEYLHMELQKQEREILHAQQHHIYKQLCIQKSIQELSSHQQYLWQLIMDDEQAERQQEEMQLHQQQQYHQQENQRHDEQVQHIQSMVYQQQNDTSPVPRTSHRQYQQVSQHHRHQPQNYRQHRQHVYSREFHGYHQCMYSEQFLQLHQVYDQQQQHQNPQQEQHFQQQQHEQHQQQQYQPYQQVQQQHTLPDQQSQEQLVPRDQQMQQDCVNPSQQLQQQYAHPGQKSEQQRIYPEPPEQRHYFHPYDSLRPHVDQCQPNGEAELFHPHGHTDIQQHHQLHTNQIHNSQSYPHQQSCDLHPNEHPPLYTASLSQTPSIYYAGTDRNPHYSVVEVPPPPPPPPYEVDESRMIREAPSFHWRAQVECYSPPPPPPPRGAYYCGQDYSVPHPSQIRSHPCELEYNYREELSASHASFSRRQEGWERDARENGIVNEWRLEPRR